MGKIRKKTMAEIRLEAKMEGAEEVFDAMAKPWREAVFQNLNKTADPGIKLAGEMIIKGDKILHNLSEEYKKIMFPRVYGEKYE